MLEEDERKSQGGYVAWMVLQSEHEIEQRPQRRRSIEQEPRSIEPGRTLFHDRPLDRAEECLRVLKVWLNRARLLLGQAKTSLTAARSSQNEPNCCSIKPKQALFPSARRSTERSSSSSKLLDRVVVPLDRARRRPIFHNGPLSRAGFRSVEPLPCSTEPTSCSTKRRSGSIKPTCAAIFIYIPLDRAPSQLDRAHLLTGF